MTANRNSKLGRKGVAAVWALVVLAVVSAMSAAAVGQFAIARRQVDVHRNQLQAEWLARSGYELAVARILADPKEYTGETVTPIPKGDVKISVKKDSEMNGGFKVECEARYPVGEKGMVIRTAHHVVKRVAGPNGVQIKALIGER